MVVSVFFAHLRIQLIQLFKEPGYVLSTLVFPALFFLIFAHPSADTPTKARFLLASFSVFAVLGVCFFQFGVQRAQEIRTGWSRFVKTLPAPEWPLFLSRWLSAVVCAGLAAAAVYVTVLLSTDLDIEFTRWLGLLLVLLLGGVPFALFSSALAHWVSEKSALPTFNLIYILSSFAGGLWLPPNALPTKVEEISRYLPTRHIGEVAWKVALAEPITKEPILHLLIFALFSLLFLGALSRSKRPMS